MEVKFRSDRDADFAILERYLGAGSLGDLPDTWRHEAEQDLDSLRRHSDELVRSMPWVSDVERSQMSELWEVDLPTRYDSPTQFRILEGLVSRVKEAANLMGLDTSTFPHHSCIPTGLVNARAVVLPNATRPFLLFDSELFLYCHLFAKAFAHCLPVVSRDEMLSLSLDTDLIKQRIRNNPELTARFSNLLSVYAATGSTSQSTRYNPETDYVHLLDIIRNGMELFVVAHEFGHVFAGHLSGPLDQLWPRSEDPSAENPSHRREYEADFIGIVLTLQAMSRAGYDPALAYVGVELFFVSLDLATKTGHVALTDEDDGRSDSTSASHPSHEDRRKFLRESLDSILEKKEQAESARSLAEKYGEIANILWQASRMSCL